MCILFFQLNEAAPVGAGYRLILASNRDENWGRPTGTVSWHQQGRWLGGIDLEPGREGGTWLGMNRSGKLAVLLNVLSVLDKKKKGRGNLVTDYLNGERSTEQYIEDVSADIQQFNQFHLYLLNLSAEEPISYLTNSGGENVASGTLKPGIYSCTNNNYRQPWRKIVHGEERFSELVSSYGEVAHRQELLEGLFSLLTDRTQYFPDEVLQKQFEIAEKTCSGEVIEQRSAVFVWSPSVSYGTRTQTVILVDQAGNCDYIERTYSIPVAETDPAWTSVTHSFKLDLVQENPR